MKLDSIYQQLLLERKPSQVDVSIKAMQKQFDDEVYKINHPTISPPPTTTN